MILPVEFPHTVPRRIVVIPVVTLSLHGGLRIHLLHHKLLYRFTRHPTATRTTQLAPTSDNSPLKQQHTRQNTTPQGQPAQQRRHHLQAYCD
ncbi:MAG UNVERIFIED_CONTAM: hypothetical protein LVR18_40075 [Planctomycetaceae bacterium]